MAHKRIYSFAIMIYQMFLSEISTALESVPVSDIRNAVIGGEEVISRFVEPVFDQVINRSLVTDAAEGAGGFPGGDAGAGCNVFERDLFLIVISDEVHHLLKRLSAGICSLFFVDAAEV